jgi:hypothetical protein
MKPTPSVTALQFSTDDNVSSSACVRVHTQEELRRNPSKTTELSLVSLNFKGKPMTPTLPVLNPATESRLQSLPEAFSGEQYTARAMQAWLQERCLFDSQTVTSFAALHTDWLQWAEANERFGSSAQRLANALKHLGLERCVRGSGTQRAYIGIALKDGGAK